MQVDRIVLQCLEVYNVFITNRTKVQKIFLKGGKTASPREGAEFPLLFEMVFKLLDRNISGDVINAVF